MIPSLNAGPVDGSDRSTKTLTGRPDAPAAKPSNNLELEAADDAGEGIETQSEDDFEPEEVEELFSRIKECESQAQTYMQATLRPKWARNLKAAHNEHFEGSKYRKPEWNGRSKLFRPKTRSAIRKALTNAAKALFGPGDIVAVQPQNAGDPLQEASAAIKQELLNYRLSRSTRRNGIRWLQITTGARFDSLVSGICISKQVWRYRTEKTGAVDPLTGAPATVVMEDKPDCILYAPENALFSPTCDWTNPAQTSEYMILRNPMSVAEAMDIIKQNSTKTKNIVFDADLTEATIRSFATSQSAGATDTLAVRAARHDGADPNQRAGSASPVVWLDEVFIRHEGRDYVFWKIGSHRPISNAVPVRDEYPAFGGERPVVIGYGTIEPHSPYPMSPVESWQQLQQELNDQANLRMDHMKQVVTPLAKVKRGKKVDIKQVMSRGANNGLIMVNDPEDVEYVNIPDVPQSAYVENNYLAADFDDLAGSFNSGSVQTNRSLNETVGGMKLLAGDANSIGEFDLTVWVETWVEPVIWQLLKLEEFYETDANVLVIAGQKAKLFERFGLQDITDELLTAETSLTVKIGMGVTNLPTERLQKFAMASQMFGQMVAPFVEAGTAKMPVPRMKDIVNAIYGDAGIPDAAERFFTGLDNEPGPGTPPGAPQGPSPQELAAQDAANKAKMADVENRKEAADNKAKLDGARLMLDAHRADMEDRRAAADRQHERGSQLIDLVRGLTDHVAARHAQERDQAHQGGMARSGHIASMLSNKMNNDARAAQMAQRQPAGRR